MSEGNMVEQDASKFATLPDEKVLVVKREHWSTLVPQLGINLLLCVVFIAGAVTLYLTYSSIITFIIITCATLLFALHITAKTVVEWSFHLYIVTTRKLLELRHSPVASSAVDDVILDQVRCTEVDSHTHGILEQIMDVGDIDITFDRPTHQQEFNIRHIEHYQKVGSLLRDALIAPKSGTTENIWYRTFAKGGRSANS